MKFLDLTLPTPAENLACDEALLDFCEETSGAEILRVWEPVDYFVVLGYANKINLETHRENCRDKGIPIFRRCSGGGTVVQGSGCLNYSLILNFADNASLQTITQANRFIMERHRELCESLLGKTVRVEGHTDLALDGLKFSGNAQRRKKTFLLFHGTFLLDFNLPMIEQLLKMPSQQPCYREHRSHKEFLINLNQPVATLKTLLGRTWNATEELNKIPEISQPLLEKYRSDEWNFKF